MANTVELAELSAVCLGLASRDATETLEALMSRPFCRMYGPEHHVLVGAALLTAYKNAGGDIDLAPALAEMAKRGGAVPAGTCGQWGAGGAGISAGMFAAIALRPAPPSVNALGFANLVTSAALARLGAIGGPSCCKRSSYLSVLAAAELVRERLGVPLEAATPTCGRSAPGGRCLGERCPFSPQGR